MIENEAGLQADSNPPSRKRMKQKKPNELTAPAPIFVALQHTHAIAKSTFRLIFPERIPA